MAYWGALNKLIIQIIHQGFSFPQFLVTSSLEFARPR